MDSLFSMIRAGFDFFADHDLFGIPLLYIFIGMAVFGLVISFLKGKGKDD